MIQRHPMLIAVICIVAIVLGSCLGTRLAGAGGLIVPSDSYVVEGVGTVRVWISERYGQLCSSVGAWPTVSISCMKLADTTYGRQIQGN